MNHSNYYLQLLGQIKEFTRAQKRRPTKLHLTDIDEWDIAKLNECDLGETAGKIWENGPRAIGDRLLGLEIVWSSESTRLE